MFVLRSMVQSSLLTWLFVLSGLASSSASAGAADIRQNRRLSSPTRIPTPFQSSPRDFWTKSIRGGATDASDQDEERYSRQVYTLGARAHGLVRSSVVYVDGPSRSGLVYECVKNLALSGVGTIAIVTSDDSVDTNYFNSQLDSLGSTYVRAARAELDDSSSDDTQLLVEFIKRLNPSLTVKKVPRSELEADRQSSDQGVGILLSVDRPYKTQVSLNELSRTLGLSFVATETAGVYGRTFCDFGDDFEVFDADGETPLVVPLDHVELLGGSEQATMTVYCVEGEKHDVSKGDVIQFQSIAGVMEPSFRVKTVHTPFRFDVEAVEAGDGSVSDTIVQEINDSASSFSRIKIPQKVAFLPLESALKTAQETGTLFTPCDLDKSFDNIRQTAIFSSFQALSKFVESEGRLPSPIEASDGSFLEMALESCSDATITDESSDWKDHCENFSRCCAAKFTPLQAIFGAIASQEVLKAASGLYNPIQQYLLYDCDEVLPSADEVCVDQDRKSISDMEYVLGKKTADKFKSKKLFVVGAGAIGCELLKNLAAMGAGTEKKGKVVVTDMDTIEKSNLSRQLLFRDNDIGKFKSLAAQEAMGRFNPQSRMEVHTGKVGDEDNGPFDNKFWSKGFDVILNALDNVEARLYMDSQCVAYQKALVDAGTLGPKGNVQVVIPHKSESYGSSADPPEPAIPVCTLKNFPYAISHTIQWGRDVFDGLFVKRAKQASEYRKTLLTMKLERVVKQVIQDMGKEPALEAAVELSEDLVSEYAHNKLDVLRKDSLAWAVKVADNFFRIAIEKLLLEHPPDSLDEDGDPFWSGSRKVPKPLFFDEENENDTHQRSVNGNLIDFVKSAARLRIETYSAKCAETKYSLISEGEARVALIEGALKQKQIDASSKEDDDVEACVAQHLKKVPADAHTDFFPAEFEKDDDSNGHVAFITAASNLRALCYGIKPVDAMETRRVAGKIVPAMITTTAFVSAASCIELVKLLQNAPLRRHRNAFINLALPFFAFTSPLPADEIQGLRGQSYTLWDRIVVKEGEKAAKAGGMTLKKFLSKVKGKATDDPESIEITTVSFGQYMIYANFLHEDDDDIMNKSIWELVQESISMGDDFDNEFSRDGGGNSGSTSTNVSSADFLDLSITVEDLEEGEEVELPPVRVQRHIPKR